MEIKLLDPRYKKDEKFYKKFIEGNLSDYISDKSVYIQSVPDFPIYFNTKDDKKREELFLKAVKVIASTYYKQNDIEIFESEIFWHSLLCIYKRDYLLKEYPSIKADSKVFKNIVLKKFDWENYIYKSVFAVKYITKFTESPIKQEYYYKLIINNLDVYNYILKYSIFRNGQFLMNVLQVIDDEGLSESLKAKLSKEYSFGKDLRRGRQVIYEFNKSYPVLLAPMLEKEELKYYFKKFLSYYE